MAKFYRIFKTPCDGLATIHFDDTMVKDCTLAIGREDIPQILKLDVGKAHQDSDGDYWIRYE